MPLRTLRYCRTCRLTCEATAGQACGSCGGELLLFLDDHGAIARGFLVARGSCCDSGCINCPYDQPEPISEKCIGGAEQKSCPRCGAGFECRSGGCWCDNVPLSPETLARLDQTYVDCLCPSCLAEFSEA